jgi:carboxyl-terminal processing protease
MKFISSHNRLQKNYFQVIHQSLTYGLLALFIGVSTFSSSSFALDCQQVRLLTQYYLKMHFGFNEFNDELSKRTLDLLLRAWDPGKLYFLQSDITRFETQYATKIDDMVNQANCKFIDDIVETYGNRFEERNAPINSILEAKHDFSIQEYMEVDRKKLSWAKTSEELNDRWRKRLKFQVMQLKETVTDPEKVKEKMKKRIVLIRKRHNETTQVQIYGIFLNAFAMSLDPHTDYMGPDELEDFRINTRLSLEGIGAVLRSEDGFTTIQSLVPGGAAQQSGQIKVDDKIVAVAQAGDAPQDVIDMDLRDVVKLIRGKENTEVRLTIVREEKSQNRQLVVSLKRQKVQLNDRAAKSKLQLVDVVQGGVTKQVKVGVITLPSFYLDFEGREKKQKNFRSSSTDMLREIDQLKAKGVEVVVVDLRNNGGGALDEAVNVSGLFIKSGPIVQSKGRDGEANVLEDKNPDVAWDGPLLVLINRQSASASEIFAGAIQDYGRGIIIGDSHTFGKGTVQTMTDISEQLGAAKVTISKFYRPAGSSTQLKGVESDIAIPDLMDELEMGEKFYDYALPWEQTKETKFNKLNLVQPFVAKLKESSRARVATDEGFKLVFEDIKTYKEGELDRSRISLKEKTAKEKEAEKAKEEKRAGHKSKKKKSAEDETEDDTEVQLADDFMLQETLRVSAEYSEMQHGKMVASMTLPEVVKTMAARKAKEATVQKPKVKPKK